MIEEAKAWAKRRWPALRLRTILFGVFFFVAAMPGVSAIGLRVYENTLMRQTEAELVAQGAALAATSAVFWPGAQSAEKAPAHRPDHFYQPEFTTVDLRTSAILPERPRPRPSTRPVDPDALKAAALIAPVIDRTTRTTLASIWVLDRTGLIVRGPDVGGDLSNLPEVREAMAGRPRTVLRRNGAYQSRYAFEWLSRASDLRLHHARPILVDGRVVGVLLLSRSPRALFRGLYEDRAKIALGVAVIFAVLLGLAGLVSRGITRPIERLSRASRDVAEGRGDFPETPATAAVEIRNLYDDFRAMAEAIDRRSSYLRDFAAAVSHEFKTPLAGIRGAVELMRDHGDIMSAQDRDQFLRNIAAGGQRLSHLVTRLLDLARADMARPQSHAATEVAMTVRRVADANTDRTCVVTPLLPGDLPPVAIPEPALESILSALIDNSRKAGASVVSISARSAGDFVSLLVSDNGVGIPKGDRDRLFEPFFTSRRSEGGTGLGLSIARSLLGASHGVIRLAEADTGAAFELELPITR